MEIGKRVKRIIFWIQKMVGVNGVWFDGGAEGIFSGEKAAERESECWETRGALE